MNVSAYRIEATVRIRRGEGWSVKPEAEEIDGKRHAFTWAGSTGDHSVYDNETAWMPDREGWPIDAPVWIASGDLVDIVALQDRLANVA